MLTADLSRAGRLAAFLLTGMLYFMFQEEALGKDSIPAPFIRLGELLGMPASADWQEYRREFMARWGRVPGQERWELKNVDLPPEIHAQVMVQLEQLRLIQAWQPQHQAYDYGILPGATLPSMKSRLDWMAQLWRRGVRFHSLIVLTGQRPLTPAIDHFPEIMSSIAPGTRIDFSHPTIFPLHETEAARLLVHFYPFPEGMDKVPVVFIDSPRQWRGFNWERSHTGDTVDEWLKHNPTPGKTLVISNQPSAHYQEAVFLRELPSSFDVEMSAPPLSPDIPLSIVLDAVSVWIRTTGDQPPAL